VKRADPRYTQINILFPSNHVELPEADKFNAFPPDAQKAILTAFEREQTERHAWFKNQQRNDHQLNVYEQRYQFVWRQTGTICGALLTLSTIGLGAWLVRNGAGATGVAMMIGAAAVLIGTAVYGHRAHRDHASPSEDKNQNPH
jgi:hypothetical protein